MNKVMDHGSYQKNLKKKSVEELRFIIKDASEAMKAMPDNPNNGYYADEVNYASMELSQLQGNFLKIKANTARVRL
jgi:hypothetical protein